MAKVFIPFGSVKRQTHSWWSAEVEEAVSERHKGFAAAHRSDGDRQAYISTSRHALSVIAKLKTKAWQATSLSFSPKSNPKSVYSFLRSFAGSFSSSFPSPSLSQLLLSHVVDFGLCRLLEIPLFRLPAKDPAYQIQTLPF